MIKFVCGNCGSETVINEPTMSGYVTSDNSTLKTVELSPGVIKNENVKEKKMSKKEERLAKLEAAGFDVSKLTSVLNPTDLDTMLNSCFKGDPIAEEIFASGYVKNTKLHRRWIMAQTMRLLGDDGRWTERMHRHYGNHYQFEMMLEELKVLSILEEEDKETFEERCHFFTKDVVVQTLKDYQSELKRQVKKSEVKENKKYGKYIKFHGVYYTLHSAEKIGNDIDYWVSNITAANNYKEMFIILGNFLRSNDYFRLNYVNKKSLSWVDAFKGAGCYYTLRNMVEFHNCYITTQDGTKLNRTDSIKYLKEVLNEYQGQYWRMLALLKKVISDNNFSWENAMNNIYGN